MANWFTIHADPSPFIRAMDFPPRSLHDIISFFSFFFLDGRLFNLLFLLFYRWFLVGSKWFSLENEGEGRETLLGLMKVLGFCNSLFEGIFFRFWESLSIFDCERNWDWWENRSMQFYRIIVRKVLFVIMEEYIKFDFCFFFIKRLFIEYSSTKFNN